MSASQPKPAAGADDQAWRTARVPAAADGDRLDVFLVTQAEVPSRSVAKELIQAGRVRVDGRRCKPGHSLAAGQIVEFAPEPPPVEGSAEPVPIEAPAILHEDDHVLVIAKPAGLLVHPSSSAWREPQPSVATWAEARCGGLPRLAGDDRPGIVHRLDKETSGVMVVAKTDDAFHFLKGEFKAQRVDKEYRAIAFGEARFDSDFIDRNIAPHPQKGDRVVIVKEGGRAASTYYEVVERFEGFTHFKCKPKTGRTHQIRVHMTSVGHGLVGDRFYRSRNFAKAELPEGAPDPGRHCLHARRLAFRHPHSHAEVAFEAPIPADMSELLDWLRANRRLRR